jgi:nucleotide-binding universal stress UspA family protein
MYEKILVAVDDSPERETVLQHAAAEAKAHGSTVQVLHVQTIDTALIGGGVIEEDTDEVTSVVRESVKSLVDQGIKADGEIREAVRPDIARAILDALKEHGANLLVIGTRRKHGLSGLVLGCVADGVAHGNPSAPVLLVP